MRIELGDWHRMRRWAEPLRFAVFVEEQSVPAEIELDSFDALSLHAVAFDANEDAVGTGRLLPDGHIGRMAVAKPVRGTGVGSALLKTLMDEARRRGHTQAVLSSQTHATEFYRKHGYSVHGSEYDDAGIPHIDMRCPL
jgi:predicted GNAT family N-acyltransferase